MPRLPSMYLGHIIVICSVGFVNCFNSTINEIEDFAHSLFVSFEHQNELVSSAFMISTFAIVWCILEI